MDEKALNISRYQHKHRAKIFDLLAHKWKGNSLTRREQKFDWRYSANPYQNQPFVYLAENQDEIVGLRAFVLQKFRLQQIVINVFSPADAIVHPSFRRKGIFSKLNHAFFTETGLDFPAVILNLTSNKMSTPACLNLGWQRTNGLRKYKYLISVAGFLTSKLSSGKTIKFPSLIEDGCCRYEISTELKAKELSNFMERNRPLDKFTNVRDEAFFNWRYAASNSTFIYTYCWKDAELQGYTIVRKSSSYKKMLEEYFATDPEILKRMFTLTMQKARIGVLKTLSVSRHQEETLKLAGFANKPDLFGLLKSAKFYVLARPTLPTYKEDDFFIHGVDIRNMENWLLYNSDAH